MVQVMVCGAGVADGVHERLVLVGTHYALPLFMYLPRHIRYSTTQLLACILIWLDGVQIQS